VQDRQAVDGELGRALGAGRHVARELDRVEACAGGEETELADHAEAPAVYVRRHGEPAVPVHQLDHMVDIECRGGGEREPLAAGLQPGRVEQALLAEEALVATSMVQGRPTSQAPGGRPSEELTVTPPPW
jgi:hypothetical protein